MYPTVDELAAVQAALSPRWRKWLGDLYPVIGDQQLSAQVRHDVSNALLGLRMALLKVDFLHSEFCEDE